MTGRTIRLGILDTIPVEYYLPAEKADPEKFIDLFERISAPFDYVTYRTTEGHFPASLDECDAYLVTGSPCSVYDTYTWMRELEAFIHAAWGSRVPLVGICFGHQLIAQTLGGRVELAERGWLLGMHEIEVDVAKPWMLGEGASHPLYFINQDQVVELPPQVERLAGSKACPNAMFTVDNRVLSLQAHPEQPKSSMHAFSRVLLDRYGLDRQVHDAALDSLAATEPDATRMAIWIKEFVSGAVGQ